ncbi:Uncharacterised protein [Mycobacterium tuberculosis]|nr:Uncharacterised protein [Mycobacterium tuberculosis]
MSRQAHTIEHAQPAFDCFGMRAFEHLNLRQYEVLHHAQVWEEFEVLEHHADPGAQLR